MYSFIKEMMIMMIIIIIIIIICRAPKITVRLSLNSEHHFQVQAEAMY